MSAIDCLCRPYVVWILLSQKRRGKLEGKDLPWFLFRKNVREKGKWNSIRCHSFRAGSKTMTVLPLFVRHM
jgi:hypothetical protein